MTNVLACILVVVVASMLFYAAGKKDAHFDIAKECDKLGAFYVGDIVYKCVRKEKK